MALRGKSLYEHCMENPELLHLLDEFDYSRNEVTPNKIYYLSASIKPWWYCKKCDFHWQEYSKNRVNHPAAPCCSGKRATKTNNFAVLYPEILKDWDYNKNELDPYTVLPGTHKRVYWKCHICGHEWSTKLYSRTDQTADCPNCSKAQTSKAERMILEYLSLTFPNTTHQRSNRKDTPEIDIIIPEIKVAIEYDGYPWHLDKLQTHIDKLNYCNSQGYTLINIAEYKNNPEIIQKVRDQYTPNHRVLYLDVSGSYNRNNVLTLIYDYFLQNGVKLKPPTKEFIEDMKKEVRRGERKDSLWNHPDYQWLHHWIVDDESIKIAKAYTYGSAEVKIKLTCPDCGRVIEKTPHYIVRRFHGCVDRNEGCGCKRFISEKHLNNIKEVNDKSNAIAKKRRQS